MRSALAAPEAHEGPWDAPLDVLRQRVGTRAASGSDASEATVALLERQPSYWEDFGAAERAILLDIDTTDADAIERGLQNLATTHHDRFFQPWQ